MRTVFFFAALAEETEKALSSGWMRSNFGDRNAHETNLARRFILNLWMIGSQKAD
jgi:hypothetical protein